MRVRRQTRFLFQISTVYNCYLFINSTLNYKHFLETMSIGTFPGIGISRDSFVDINRKKEELLRRIDRAII